MRANHNGRITADRLWPRRARLRVGFLLMHNFTLTAFSTFVDVLRLAADEGDKSRPIACTWQIMGPHRKPRKSSCGVVIEPSSELVDPGAFDYIVVVGGLLHGAPPIEKEVVAYLHGAAAAGVPLIGVCTGSFVLCRLGLMTGRKCCVSWFHYRDFTDEFPDLVPVADRLYVVDRDRITCSGGAGVADLAAMLVSKSLGAARAQKALHIMQIDRLRPETTAQPAPPLSVGSDDDRVSRALLLMEQQLAEPMAIGAIAVCLNMSARQLERMFHMRLGVSPRESYMAIRLKHAKWMLENTNLSSATIAAELGFVDGGHLSRSFKSRYRVTPTAFRARVPANAVGRRGGRCGDNEDRRVFD
jgi:transcriptional regulator GlxA family with amidase domain